MFTLANNQLYILFRILSVGWANFGPCLFSVLSQACGYPVKSGLKCKSITHIVTSLKVADTYISLIVLVWVVNPFFPSMGSNSICRSHLSFILVNQNQFFSLSLMTLVFLTVNIFQVLRFLSFWFFFFVKALRTCFVVEML